MMNEHGKDRFNIHGIIGLGILIVADIMMFRGVEPFVSWFYCFAWWSYILIADSLVYRIRGNSLLMNRTKEFFLLLPWSVAVWLFFELVNLALKNWYYINIPRNTAMRWIGYMVAYSTVLPGIFETTELLESLGLYRGLSVRAIPESRKWYIPFWIVGGAFLILPITLPQYCFPLIWGSLVFLLEPINHRFGGKSLMRDWERGNPSKFLLLLTAGLACGLFWEFWNFWARSKWVYTVPFFDELKGFEMPFLGFLGFPPFAVECYAIYNFISLFRHKRGWERDQYTLNLEHRTRPMAIAVSVLGLAIFYAFVFHSIDTKTINSYIARVSDLNLIEPEYQEKLEEMDLHTVDDLFQRIKEPEGRKELGEKLGISDDQISDWAKWSQLIRLKGLGVKNFLLLRDVGVDDVQTLARQQPFKLYEKLVRANEADPITFQPIDMAKIKIWIRAARKTEEIL
jgi:multisubunit Na+/H+ antiporter MnhB subunit